MPTVITTGPPADGIYRETFKIAGISYRREVAQQFICGVQACEASGRPWGLVSVPEPDNPHDPNAIRVDGWWTGPRGTERVHVGYWPAEEAVDADHDDNEFSSRAVRLYMGDDGFCDVTMVPYATGAEDDGGADEEPPSRSLLPPRPPPSPSRTTPWWGRYVLAAAVVGLVIFGARQNTPTTVSRSTPQALAPRAAPSTATTANVAVETATVALVASPPEFLEPHVSVRVGGGDRPIVYGQTNMPGGTGGLVTIRRRSSSYLAQVKIQVLRGAFEAGPLSQQGSPLDPGEYTVEVTFGVARVQPAHVEAVYGREGKRLRGPLVTRTPYGGNVVEMKTKFRVPGKTSATVDAKAMAQQKVDMVAWWKQSCRDICRLAGQASGDPRPLTPCIAKCEAEQPSF